MTISVDENTNLENYRISDSTFREWGMIKNGTEDTDTMVFFEFSQGVQDQLYCMSYNDPSIKIDFSINEVQELINYIYEFTLKLSKESKNNTMNFKCPSNNSKNNIICLKDYLKYQKELASA